MGYGLGAERGVGYVGDANDVEFDRGTFEWDDLSVYKRGVYCSFYNTNGDLLLSADKEDMDFSGVPFMANKIRTVRSGDKEYYLYDHYVDMEVSGLWIRGVVLTDSHQGITDIILRLTVIILPIILIVTFLGALWISSRTFKPIEKIVATANSINDADDLTDRIALKRGPKEMKQLAGAFDRMFERLEKVFDAERQFTSDASHELRTPTAIILAECDRAKRKAKTPEDYRESIDNISEQVSCEEFVPADDRGIRMETEIDPGIECSFNASLMSRVIYNLLQNAYKYGRDNGYVRLSLSREDSDAVIRVKDNGIGIKKEDLDKIWQRFWQADSSRGSEGGNGLGLAMVKEIAELHGGSVTAESTEGRGSEFIFSLPAVSG